ncbi:hypothetical protein JHK87_013506 [Glycine soja]|nr:hypothetical protein JHK87_013506 [Glycine soja]
MEALRSMDFWTLFVSFLCGVGTNLVVVNNMVQGSFNLEEKMLLDLFNDGLSRCMMALTRDYIDEMVPVMPETKQYIKGYYVF